MLTAAPEMDNNQDVIRFYPATKRHLHKPPSVSEKSRKEKFQKLSLVGTRVNPETEMSSDQENEHIISMLAAKRFKLPGKFLDEDHASVPRKLRSAMKKRSGSLSPPLQDPKKMKHQPRGRDSPKKETVKKVKKQKLKQKRMEHAKSTRANGSITKDEEEVVETLYALSGMFIADGRSGAADGSSQDLPSTVNGATESTKIEGIHEGSLGDDAAEAINTKRKTEEQTNMLDSFEEAKQKNTDLLTTTEPSRENLMIRLNVDSRPMAINLEHQHKVEDHNRDGASLSPPKCPVLWPGLLTASRNSMDASLRSSSNREPPEFCYSTEKTCKTTVGKVLWKKCTGHVYISRMIRTLQNPDSKDGLFLLNGREEEAKQGIVEVGLGLAVLQNGGSGTVSTNLQEKRTGNGRLPGSHVAQIYPTEKQRLEFLSLVNGSGTMMPQFQVPYIQSYHQHRIPITHPAHKIHYSNPYPDQLSTASSHQLQLPTYQVGSSGRSLLQKGPTWEHQQAVWTVSQIASSQYKHLGSSQVAQFPGWQNGRDESSAAMHDLMTQYNRNHHHQQQLQLPLRSSMAGPSHRGSFL